MLSELRTTVGATWTTFIESLDSSGGHLLVFLALYLGMCYFHSSEQDRTAVFQAMLLVLRPGGQSK